MLLTITTTYQPATELGYLLHKHPDRVQTFSLNFGQAHVFYPEVSTECCTIALLLELNTVELVRGRDNAFALEQYVNDRPYVASSFLSVALSEIFRTAMNGRCDARPELVTTALPLTAQLAAIPSRGGEEWLKRLFVPLGYEVAVTTHPLDEQQPDWGTSPYYTLTLERTCTLSELLTHLYVLVPVLDDDKHYWIGDDEVEKLLRHGKGWLEQHPERNHIAYRYLKHRGGLVRDVIKRLLAEEQAEDEKEEDTEEQDGKVEGPDERKKRERPTSLHDQRLEAVLGVLQASGAKSVLDLGCGEGRLLKLLLQNRQFERILGMDVSYRVLEMAQKRLYIDRMPTRQKERITLIHGSLTYRDKRLEGYDAAAVVEVIEHMDQPRLSAFERAVFEFAHPQTVVITTPNAEYNVKFETLQAGKFRHHDHRFEWSRAQFVAWAERVAAHSGYSVHFMPIGPEDAEVGAPSQMGVFSHLR